MSENLSSPLFQTSEKEVALLHSCHIPACFLQDRGLRLSSVLSLVILAASFLISVYKCIVLFPALNFHTSSVSTPVTPFSEKKKTKTYTCCLDFLNHCALFKLFTVCSTFLRPCGKGHHCPWNFQMENI